MIFKRLLFLYKCSFFRHCNSNSVFTLNNTDSPPNLPVTKCQTDIWLPNCQRHVAQMPMVINPNAVPVYQTGPMTLRHASITHWTCLCELWILVISFNSSNSYRQFWLPSPIHWLQMVGTITMHHQFHASIHSNWTCSSYIHFITIIVKCGFVLCKFTDSSLNQGVLNSSPHFVPSVKITSWWNSLSILHFSI